jgi:hypothetical protein
MKGLGQSEHLAYHALNVFLFVIGGYDNETVAQSSGISGQR